MCPARYISYCRHFATRATKPEDKIKEDHKDDKAFGPDANYFICQIEEIIENEPKNFKEVIRLGGVRSNMDLSSEYKNR